MRQPLMLLGIAALLGCPQLVGLSDLTFSGSADRRALSADEVWSRFQRGHLLAATSVRVCESFDCSDNPDFSNAYTDPANALAPGTAVDLQVPVGRFFQYRASLETRITGNTPKIASVTVSASRQ